MSRPFVSALGLAFLVAVLPVLAQSEGSGMPSSFATDPGFERFVDLDALADAWEEKDSDMLTDLALQIAEGERVLLRSRRGISADQAFRAAAAVAAERNDKESLARLNKALTALGRGEVLADVKRAEKLGGASRAAEPTLMINVEATSPLAFGVMQDTLEAIRCSKLGQNAKAFEAIVAEIPKMDELTETQRNALLKIAKDAQSTLPQDAKDAAPTVTSLNKLLDESRAGKGGGGGGGKSSGGGGKSSGGGPHTGGNHPGGTHPGGNHPGGNHPGGNHAGGHHPGGHHPSHVNGHNHGHSAQHNHNFRTHVSIQSHWQRRFHHRFNFYVYWDPTISRYYYLDTSCSCYAVLAEDGDG